jgi:hydroxyacylglutathione hydrolase
MTFGAWFQTQPVAPKTWAIDDGGNDIIYLIAGSQRALLLDTGWGVADLLGLVASLTKLPLTVVNSHGHPDHTFGNGQFTRVHIHPADAPMVRHSPPPERRRWIAQHVLGASLPDSFDVRTWATSVPELLPLQDGQTFDLGDRTLQIVTLPGHSSGSICLLDLQERLLFTGDFVLPGVVWLHLDESLPLQTFLAHLYRVRDLADKFDSLLPSHGDLVSLHFPTHTLADLAHGIERILRGKVVGKEEHTFAGDGLRCDFGTCGIVYNPDRLR